MRSAAKFLFDTSFDSEASESAEHPAKSGAPAESSAPPEPRYGDAELAAARERGLAEGRAAAEAEATAAASHRADATLQAIRDALPGLARQIDEGLAACSQIMLDTALVGFGRLMPELSRRGGLAEIEGLLQHTLADLRDESRVVVRLPDSQLDGLRERLDPLARSAGFEGRLVLLADEDIEAGDCRIEWADGGVERAASRVWSDIEAAVKRALSAASGTTAGVDPANLNTGSGANEPQET